MTQYKDHAKFKKAKDKAEKILRNPEKVKNLLNMVLNKLSSMDGNKVKTGDFFRRVNTFIRMVRAYVRGEYRGFPWKMVVMVLAALIYFLMPLDVLPDFIPITGFLDDITVVLWVFNHFKKEIDEFEAWENSITVPE